MTKKHVSLLVVFVLLFTTLFSSFAFAANDVEWEVAEGITIKANYHQQTYGDQEATGKGAITFGKIGESKRLEAIGLSLEGAPADMEIRYGVHAQTYGDLPKDEAKNPILAVGPAVAGTKGEAKRLEGVQIGLYKKGTDDLYPGYQISYQVHMKGYGWGADADNNWYKGNEDAFMADGKFAGTKGLARWIEAVSIVIEKEAKLSVKDVTADNLIQLVVEFNQDVTDNDAVANIENYALEDAKGKKVEDIADVDVDGNFATITLEDAVDNQTKAFLVLNKAILGAEEEIEVRFYDNTAPVAKDAEVIGSNTIKVDFSEPVTTDSLANKEFEVKSADGKTTYGIRSVTPQKNNTEVLIELRKAVEDGDELVLTVSKNNGIQDYFRYKVVATEFELTVEEDNRDIEVVGQKNAKEEGITLVFNKNIKVDDPKNTNFYHTNSRNTVDSDKGAVADGNEHHQNEQ